MTTLAILRSQIPIPLCFYANLYFSRFVENDYILNIALLEIFTLSQKDSPIDLDHPKEPYIRSNSLELWLVLVNH